MRALDTLRALLGIGCRRTRSALGLGDRRQSPDAVREDARRELERLAHIRQVPK